MKYKVKTVPSNEDEFFEIVTKEKGPRKWYKLWMRKTIKTKYTGNETVWAIIIGKGKDMGVGMVPHDNKLFGELNDIVYHWKYRRNNKLK